VAEFYEWLQQVWLVLEVPLEFLLSIMMVAGPYALWFAYCLWAINWKKLRPALAEGAWAPAILVMVFVAVIWSQIWPGNKYLAPFNFAWQFLALSLLAGLGLFAGWIQERYAWTPAEIAVEPAAHGHGHDHSHDHSHTHDHGHGHH
jgi:ABC-type nickel/cobalt efflux system permease component RcnA